MSDKVAEGFNHKVHYAGKDGKLSKEDHYSLTICAEGHFYFRDDKVWHPNGKEVAYEAIPSMLKRQWGLLDPNPEPQSEPSGHEAKPPHNLIPPKPSPAPRVMSHAQKAKLDAERKSKAEADAKAIYEAELAAMELEKQKPAEVSQDDLP